MTPERLAILEKYKVWMSSNNINFELYYNGSKRSFSGKLVDHDGYPAFGDTAEETMLIFFLHHCQEELEILRDNDVNDLVIIPNFFLEDKDGKNKC